MRRMEKRKAIGIIALAVLLCFAVFSIGSVVFVAQHADHDCTGAHCEVCLQLHRALEGIRLLARPVALVAAGVLLFLLVAGVALRAACFPVPTPVARRVRLNN